MPALRGTTVGHDVPLLGHAVAGLARVTLVAALAGACVPAQAQVVPLRVDVSLSDFGVERVGRILRGRVAVVHAEQGERLAVHFLASTPAPTTRPVNAPVPLEEPVEPAVPDSLDVRRRSIRSLRSLWVWNTAELLAEATARATFLAFVEEQGIDRIFLQLPPGPGLAPAAGFVPFDGAAIGLLVAELRARGALTYALDGDPEYARPGNHDGVARTVARVAAHNRAAPPEQRFHGVRYDVEPYVLPGFQGPRRPEILADWVRLLEVVADAARAGDLAFGVDIPFWLDGVDEVTGEPFEVEAGGSRRPVLARILELVDDVGVMAYRTTASGPDGVIVHTAGELARARQLDVDVFVGVETTSLPDEDRYVIRGPGRTGLPPDLDAAWIVLDEVGEDLATVWLVQGAEAIDALRRSAGTRADRLTYWFAGTPVPLPGSRLSFHTLGPGAMRSVTAEVLQALGGADAFRGVAYHDYVGLKALLAGP